MAVNPKDVKELIEILAEKKGEIPDHKGFDNISDLLSDEKIPIRGKFLYDTYRAAEEAIKNDSPEIRTRLAMLDTIAKAAGYTSYLTFLKKKNNPTPEIFKSYIGNWWSIVRANAVESLLLAPVKIYLDESETRLLIDMIGGQQLFKGTVQLRAGNLFCELDSGKEKIFYIVLKVGANEKVRVLQGVFSGISSAGDPIGGRELFVREDKLPFEEMRWKRIPVVKEKGENDVDDRVFHYYSTYEGNCIKINKVSTFSYDDLIL